VPRLLQQYALRSTYYKKYDVDQNRRAVFAGGRLPYAYRAALKCAPRVRYIVPQVFPQK
jgi:hypothetical protein